MHIREMVWQYIGDEPMACTDCESLSKGMKGTYDPSVSQYEANYLFPNGFWLDITFIKSRPDLFQLVDKNEVV